jgi:hypothetical protein
LVSCVEDVDPNLIENIGLDISADGRIFVVSPDTDELKVVQTDPSSGQMLTMDSYSLGWRPADVFVGDGPSVYGTEFAVVVGSDASGLGRALIIADTEYPSSWYDLDARPMGSEPVSTVMRYDGRRAYVVLEGTSEIRVIDLFLMDWSDEAYTVGGGVTPRRVLIQRDEP